MKISVTKITAVHISAPTQELLTESAKALEEYLPSSWTLPCGNTFVLNSIADLPQENKPCPCGDKGHWFVRYEIRPQTKEG